MRADICDPTDAQAVERFRTTLHHLGASIKDTSWGLGVSVNRVRIGSEELLLFSDSYSIDVEGPEELVKRVMQEYAGLSANTINGRSDDPA
jgi:hypothetical protein